MKNTNSFNSPRPWCSPVSMSVWLNYVWKKRVLIISLRSGNEETGGEEVLHVFARLTLYNTQVNPVFFLRIKFRISLFFSLGYSLGNLYGKFSLFAFFHIPVFAFSASRLLFSWYPTSSLQSWILKKWEYSRLSFHLIGQFNLRLFAFIHRNFSCHYMENEVNVTSNFCKIDTSSSRFKLSRLKTCLHSRKYKYEISGIIYIYLICNILFCFPKLFLTIHCKCFCSHRRIWSLHIEQHWCLLLICGGLFESWASFHWL